MDLESKCKTMVVTRSIIIIHLTSSMWLKWWKTFYAGHTVVYSLQHQTIQENLLVGGYLLLSLLLYICFFRSGISLGSIRPVARTRQNTK